MSEHHVPLLTRSFLRSLWANEYDAWQKSDADDALRAKLSDWDKRLQLNETAAESAFEQVFFQELWGYRQSGQSNGDTDYFSHHPQFPVKGGSAKGGTGKADAALGHFGPSLSDIPQVLCEYKDARSGLDTPQKRGGDYRTPVRQGLDYLAATRRNLPPLAAISPQWAIITDMNEFRLYSADKGDRESMRFLIRKRDMFDEQSLLDDTDAAQFDRFVFTKLFSSDMLLVQSQSGKSPLDRIIERKWINERKLEKTFYKDYRAYRDHLYNQLLKHNPEGSERFPGTKGRLVRLSQKILDRFIFIFFCEDMGERISYPPQLLRDFLLEQTSSSYFDPNAFDIWERLKTLFGKMNLGGTFGAHEISRFNGGLFAEDESFSALRLPNSVFCAPGQGINEASLEQYKLTLLYMSARYNYATGFGEQPDEASQQADELGLYTLGHIFEQSITELEVLEAEAEGRKSLNKISRRKRDGVYYTPEWVVERIIEDTLGRRLDEMKIDCGWPLSVDEQAKGRRSRVKALKAYREKLSDIRIVDPACGSGAFLITALRRLVAESGEIQDLLRQNGEKMVEESRSEALQRLLSRNIYGVDINSASVEIAKLALWLHTADGRAPLSTLDHTIREGNSLIGPEFFASLADPTAEELERVNPFDWEHAFPEVFDESRPNGAGFDVVVGNPPYVKLQNFRKVHADMAGFLKTDRAGNQTYKSTQTGNFDLYLPFIEKGIELLNDKGRLGYIAPNVWVMNQYGEGLRNYVEEGKHLEGWIDFGSHQIFDEATIYTSLQYFTKASNKTVSVIRAYDGNIRQQLASEEVLGLPYKKLSFRDRWLLATGKDREIFDQARSKSRYLDDKRLTKGIYVGVQTSADDIYHLRYIAPGKYLCQPNAERGFPSFEADIEDEIMKPLVSGPQAKRYTQPIPSTHILFPYKVEGKSASVISQSDMGSQFPKAWVFLKKWEAELRGRQSSAFDDEEWYRFGRSQNLARQEHPKLIVAQTVSRMQVTNDSEGEFYLNNVRVNGIQPAPKIDSRFLLGCLNSEPTDFLFRLIAKPKDNRFFEANKQFIAPLPIPKAPSTTQNEITFRAKELQESHTRRRNLVDSIGKRLDSIQVKKKPDNWLFSDLPLVKREALSDGETITEAKAKHKAALEARHADLGDWLVPGVTLSAQLLDGELQFLIDGRVVVSGIFPKESEATFIIAQWNYLATTFPVTARTSGKKLADALRSLAVETEDGRVQQIMDKQKELDELSIEIVQQETELNEIVYDLYGLSAEQKSYIKTSLSAR